MMQAVRGDPNSGGIFEATEREQHEEPFYATAALKAAMCEQAMVTNVNSAAKHVRADEAENQARPTKQPRHAGEERQRVHRTNGDHVVPGNLVTDAVRLR
jgi:hypothetical protein